MSALEARYFAEADMLRKVMAVETDLVDDYARKRLPEDLRARFETGYMATPERRERVRFAEALAARLDGVERGQQPSWSWASLKGRLVGPRPALRYAAGFVVLLIAVGGVWIFLEDREHPADELAVAPVARDETRPAVSEPQPALSPGPKPTEPLDAATPNPASPAEPKPPPRIVSLALTIGGVRSGDNSRVPTLLIPRGASAARLSLSLAENAHPSYRLSLQTSSGREIVNDTVVKPRGTTLILTVPSDKLAAGDYVLTVAGIEDDSSVETLGRSLFRVRR